MVTAAFKDAAAAQSAVLGFEPAIVWVAHPIQNRTQIELRELAETSIHTILSMIVSYDDSLEMRLSEPDQ
ncbi:hypothetical protein KFU94_09190 [Chloroflexi bacterium TSY]|nr:hypothetical protein [Chloroflexi bacterium TSY]